MKGVRGIISKETDPRLLAVCPLRHPPSVTSRADSQTSGPQSAESKLAAYERALCEAQRTGEAAEVGDLFGPASVCAMSLKQVSIEVLRARVVSQVVFSPTASDTHSDLLDCHQAAARVRATQKNDTGPPPSAEPGHAAAGRVRGEPAESRAQKEEAGKNAGGYSHVASVCILRASGPRAHGAQLSFLTPSKYLSPR